MQYNLKLPGAFSLTKQAWSMFKEKFNPLVKISLIVFVLSVLVEVIFPAKIVDGVQVFTWPYTIRTLVVAVVALLCSIAMLYVINNNLSARESLEKAPKILWPYFLTSLLAGLVSFVGFLLLIIPGIIFSAWYAFSAMVVVVEDIRYKAALKKSKEYVSGHVGEVILRGAFMLLMIMVLMIPSFIINKYGLIYSNIYDALVFLFLSPFIEVYLYLIYKHLKEIKNTNTTPEQPTDVQA